MKYHSDRARVTLRANVQLQATGEPSGLYPGRMRADRADGREPARAARSELLELPAALLEPVLRARAGR